MDEIFTLASVIEDIASPKHDLIEAKIYKLNSPALALLFVSQSRLLFKYNCRFFRGISAEFAQRRSQDPTWRELGTMFLNSPVPLQQFERVLADVENSVRQTYESERISGEDRKDIEKYMLITGSVSSRLWAAVESLLTITVKNVKEEVNVAELYFHDRRQSKRSMEKGAPTGCHPEDRTTQQSEGQAMYKMLLCDGGCTATKGDGGLAD
ncbi:MAG: hypothetical protein Q9222_004865 [Ikaeria aurantiellina]